jgi:peptidoglycan hydrolase-like protein with peptidoglycan-binding domain
MLTLCRIIIKGGISLKKMLRPLSCSLAAIVALTIVVASPKIGPFGVDAVSAATGAAPTTPTTPTKPNTSVPVSGTRLLKFNSMGNDVKLLQTKLNSNGYKLVADGTFGKLTLAAVKNYQSKNGLVADGLVGPLTLAKLNAVVVVPKPPVVTPPVVTPPVVDVVTTASLVDNAADFEKSIGKDGPWIISTLKDLTSTKNLVLEGDILNKKVPAVLQRKIALYTQDDAYNVTARFILTAPKLTILSPNARIQGGTFKGDVYVSVANFQLVDAVVDGNVYFTTQEAKDTFKFDAKSLVKGNKILTEVDAVTTASIVRTGADFEKAISKTGSWIPCILNDLTINKDLVLDGEFRNTKIDPVTNLGAIARKIGLYSQDDKHVTTRKFTLTVKSLTVNSPFATIQKGTFEGDLYIAAAGFTLKETKVVGNVYFATQALKDAFVLDSSSSISGIQAVKTK